MSNHKNSDNIIWFDALSLKDINRVGGKNASLGEMISCLSKLKVSVPNGFAITADVYRAFLQENELDKKIQDLLENSDVNHIGTLQKTGKQIREWILNGHISKKIEHEIHSAYQKLESYTDNPLLVAVRSSATAEDLPTHSFAGQQETILNVSNIPDVLQAVKLVYASLFTDRAIIYRTHNHIQHQDVAMSIGIQIMIRSDCGASGVMFTLDTESGFENAIFLTASYGLGELQVQGAINPDEFYIYKPALSNAKRSILTKKLGSKKQKMVYDKTQPKNVNIITVSEADQNRFSITDEEIQELARLAIIIEKHYGQPMDIEWAKDGLTKQIYIVQARPETVKSHHTIALERYSLINKGAILLEGRSVGQRIGQGNVVIMKSLAEMERFIPGSVLVTEMTDPNWEPILKQASAIITDRGGRTCHAAIVARELGIPAVVGCGNATDTLNTGISVTVSCAEGETGLVYKDLLDYKTSKIDIKSLPTIPIKLMMNIGDPGNAFNLSKLPNDGVGLARLEFIINQIGIHPNACLDFQKCPLNIQQIIADRIKGYDNPVNFYVEKLIAGISTIAAAFWPKPVTVRLSDFKSNEYSNLLGGSLFEPHEENPMMGLRGASRYLSESFKPCFELECRALKCAREDYGLTNIEIMIPFVRTVDELKKVINLLSDFDLKRGQNGLRIIMMCEVPSNAILADAFLEHVDGYSIGSNDLTQLTLGVDRDSGLIANLFDERDPNVKVLFKHAIDSCKKLNKTISICGQGPSDYPEFAKWLVEQGIDSISLNPDSILTTWLNLAEKNEFIPIENSIEAIPKGI